MAKTFYYDSVGLTEATITAGTISGTTMTVSAGAITNEEYIIDSSIAQALSSFGNNDIIRIDFSDVISANFVLHYVKTANSLDFAICKSSHATNSVSVLATDAASTVGWNLNLVAIDTRYVFLASTEGTFADLTEVIIGTKLDFENEPDIGGSTQRVFATDTNISLGGVEYASKRHEAQNGWTLNFKNISETFKNNLSSMENKVQDFKKFVYYDGTNYNYVRLANSISFVEVAHQRYSASIKLREQLS